MKDNKAYDNDLLLDDLTDLYDSSWRAYYAGAFYKLGRTTIERLASVARADGKHPSRLFGYLVKQELANRNKPRPYPKEVRSHKQVVNDKPYSEVWAEQQAQRDAKA